ncbi:MAG: hypothetical protein ABIT71_13865 [Vicinamibacteraceae bacterium]
MSRPTPSAPRSWFYVWVAGAAVLVAFGGFAPTFWLQLPAGTFVGTPLLYLHGFLFSAWTLFFLQQTVVAAQGRVARHRAWGLLGISLATAMVCVGVAAADETLIRRLAAGYGDRARAFHLASISMIALFGVLVAAAIATVTRPEIHKRLMLLSMAAVMPPAIARVFFAFGAGIAPGLRPGLGPPRTMESVLAPALLADAFLIAGLIHDWRTRGRPHPTYLIGGGVVVLVQLLRGPVSATAWWYSVADFMARFSG